MSIQRKQLVSCLRRMWESDNLLSVAVESCDTLDPRIRRTRRLLQDALEKLLETKEFDQISVQDISETATVNRATFYDHYNDKFALLECLVAGRFRDLLAERKLQFDGGCGTALNAIVLALGDYMARSREFKPHMESAIIAVLRRILLQGLEKHPAPSGLSPEMIAAAASWGIYGAAKEWVQKKDRCPSDEMADTVTALVGPILFGTKDLTG